jgi:hypothetical protein
MAWLSHTRGESSATLEFQTVVKHEMRVNPRAAASLAVNKELRNPLVSVVHGRHDLFGGVVTVVTPVATGLIARRLASN